MNFKQKLGYMFIGCLFTIAGYILASLGGNTTLAQQGDQVIDKVVCKQLEVVNEEGKIGVIIGTRPGGITGSCGFMEVYNNASKRGVLISAHKRSGSIDVYNNTGISGVRITAYQQGGHIGVHNNTPKTVVSIGTTENGNGFIQTYKGVWRTY